ncbi:hypothetical protein CPT32_24425 [Rhizobium sophoriradicis]|uniref:hypothetical protein n=1 Tax=Rhizobium sophoriradicis TaxID=1535245 RepID=UPI000BBD4C18|nr:hypothetical protein [Rhizobium sophoriradicis]PCK84394.1 hypothetical protein CPT32_24425 [Rhizobium sophoriradicis]
MIGRGFLLGVAFGCVLGVYIAPHLGRPAARKGDISETILPQLNIVQAEAEKATWPTDDETKAQLFNLSKWDLKKHGIGSKVSVNRCIQISQSEMACELLARLTWIDGETQIEAVFQAKPGGWKMVAAKNR